MTPAGDPLQIDIVMYLIYFHLFKYCFIYSFIFHLHLVCCLVIQRLLPIEVVWYPDNKYFV